MQNLKLAERFSAGRCVLATSLVAGTFAPLLLRAEGGREGTRVVNRGASVSLCGMGFGLILGGAVKKQIPIIMLTTADEAHELTCCSEIGRGVFVSKPVAEEL